MPHFLSCLHLHLHVYALPASLHFSWYRHAHDMHSHLEVLYLQCSRERERVPFYTRCSHMKAMVLKSYKSGLKLIAAHSNSTLAAMLNSIYGRLSILIV